MLYILSRTSYKPECISLCLPKVEYIKKQIVFIFSRLYLTFSSYRLTSFTDQFYFLIVQQMSTSLILDEFARHFEAAKVKRRFQKYIQNVFSTCDIIWPPFDLAC